MKREEGETFVEHTPAGRGSSVHFTGRRGNVESLVGTLEMNSRCVCDSGTV